MWCQPFPGNRSAPSAYVWPKLGVGNGENSWRSHDNHGRIPNLRGIEMPDVFWVLGTRVRGGWVSKQPWMHTGLFRVLRRPDWDAALAANSAGLSTLRTTIHGHRQDYARCIIARVLRCATICQRVAVSRPTSYLSLAPPWGKLRPERDARPGHSRYPTGTRRETLWLSGRPLR